MHGMEQVEEEGPDEEIVDPEDPLYGLDQRLKHIPLDEETKKMIKERLV